MRGDPYPSFEYSDVPGTIDAWRKGTFSHEQWRELFHPGRRKGGIDIVLEMLKEVVEELSTDILEGAYLMGRRDVMDALVSNPNFGQQEADWLYQRATDDLKHITQILEYTHTHDHATKMAPGQEDPEVSRAHKMNQKIISGRAYYTFRALMNQNKFPASQNLRTTWLEQVLEGPSVVITPHKTPTRAPQTLAQGLLFNPSTSQEELLQLVNYLAPPRSMLYEHLLEHPNRSRALIQACIDKFEEETRPAYSAGRMAFLLSEREELLQYPEAQELIRQRGKSKQLARLIEAAPELMIPVMEDVSAPRQEKILKHFDDNIHEDLTQTQLKAMLSLLSPKLRQQAIRWVGQETTPSSLDKSDGKQLSL